VIAKKVYLPLCSLHAWAILLHRSTSVHKHFLLKHAMSRRFIVIKGDCPYWCPAFRLKPTGV